MRLPTTAASTNCLQMLLCVLTNGEDEPFFERLNWLGKGEPADGCLWSASARLSSSVLPPASCSAFSSTRDALSWSPPEYISNALFDIKEALSEAAVGLAAAGSDIVGGPSGATDGGSLLESYRARNRDDAIRRLRMGCARLNNVCVCGCVCVCVCARVCACGTGVLGS